MKKLILLTLIITAFTNFAIAEGIREAMQTFACEDALGARKMNKEGCALGAKNREKMYRLEAKLKKQRKRKASRHTVVASQTELNKIYDAQRKESKQMPGAFYSKRPVH